MLFTEVSVPLWTAIAALAAVGTALVTSVYTYLTLQMFRAQAVPRVIVYVRQGKDSPFQLLLVVENIGKDIAFDVQFSLSRPIPEYASGLNPDTARVANIMNSGPIIEGIPSLEPGGVRELYWGQYGGLTKALENGHVDVTITYRHGKRRMSSVGVLEVASFSSVTANTNPHVKMADGIKDVAKHLGRIESKLAPLEVRQYEEDEEDQTIG